MHDVCCGENAISMVMRDDIHGVNVGKINIFAIVALAERFAVNALCVIIPGFLR